MTDTVWIHQARPRTAWYDLDEEARAQLRSKWAATDAASRSAIRIGEYSIRGQSDYSTVELWSFPSSDEAYTFWEARVRTDYAVWFAFSNQLGVPMPAARESNES